MKTKFGMHRECNGIESLGKERPIPPVYYIQSVTGLTEYFSESNNRFLNLTMNEWKIEIECWLINSSNKNPFKLSKEKG